MVQIKQGHQYFILDYCTTKRECGWMARMFHTALAKHDAERDAKFIRRKPRL